jgi:hypothetical protein
MEDLSMKTKITFALIACTVLMSLLMTCTMETEEVQGKITVTFDSKGDDLYGSVTLVKGGSLGDSYPTPAEREGFKFKGWYDGFNECTRDTEIYVDLTLVAHWIGTEFVIVTFDSNNGTPDFAPISVPKGGALGVRFPSNPRRYGFALENWTYKNENNEDIVFDKDTPITANITITAQWSELTTEYTVTFSTGTGATTIAPIKVYEGECIDEWEARFSSFVPQYTGEVSPPAKGRSFREWIYDPTGLNIIFTGRTPVTRNITLVAQWRYVIDVETFDIDLSYCLTIPGDEYTDLIQGTNYTRYVGDNHPLLNYPLPTVEFKNDAYVFTFSGKNSAIAIETPEYFRELLLVANSVTVEVEGTAEPASRLFRILIGDTITYAEGWNATKNISPTLVPLEELSRRDLVIEESVLKEKPSTANYVFIQTNRDLGNNGLDVTTIATIKSIKVTLR